MNDIRGHGISGGVVVSYAHLPSSKVDPRTRAADAAVKLASLVAEMFVLISFPLGSFACLDTRLCNIDESNRELVVSSIKKREERSLNGIMSAICYGKR